MCSTARIWIVLVGAMTFIAGCGKEVSNPTVKQRSVADSEDLSFAASESVPIDGASSREAPAGRAPTSTDQASSTPANREPMERRPESRANSVAMPRPPMATEPPSTGDRFDPIVEDSFHAAVDEPLSTFSIDVDTASYAKTRTYLMNNGIMPPADAVRIEEMINYFDYEYAAPDGKHPFAVHVETSGCPWNRQNRIVRVGLKGKELHGDRPASNLVFLIDVSGSMNAHNKLPLVKQGLRMLVDRLTENDRVAICVYAGAAGMVLPPIQANHKSEIYSAIDHLHAGGSTNGGQGIQLAYRTALDNFLKGGVNRVILCSDGDFNVGVTNTGELVRLAERHAKAGVFLSVLGFGVGNHNDSMMEQLSNKANGNYAFIDNQSEAYKVLVEQLSGTLVTIARDVKIQVEFNPARVSNYRLVGYGNRRLAARDFNDDSKDAGEIGAGHTVTALYEVTPIGASGSATPGVDPLKYQPEKNIPVATSSDELLTVKLRYKLPDADVSTRLELPVVDSGARFEDASSDLRFAAAVAAFGMLLQHSEYARDMDFPAVYQIARNSLGNDRNGYRGEFLEMIQRAAQLSGQQISKSLVPPGNRYQRVNQRRAATTPTYVYVSHSRSQRPILWYIAWAVLAGIGASTLVAGGVIYLVTRQSRQMTASQTGKFISR